jgi:hypothetical protein
VSNDGLFQMGKYLAHLREREPIIQDMVKTFLRQESLYKNVSLELVNSLVAFYPHTVLLYCIACKAERPFHDSIPIKEKIYPVDEKGHNPVTGVYTYDYACTGCGASFMCWVFIHFEANSIQKVGQRPSVADLYSGDLSKYRKILGNKYVEFNRAVGLNAHGVGIGAFVYLRRIFEDLVTEAYAVASQESSTL